MGEVGLRQVTELILQKLIPKIKWEKQGNSLDSEPKTKILLLVIYVFLKDKDGVLRVSAFQNQAFYFTWQWTLCELAK